ncbi:UNVERIFIED_CONTAM: putative late blight resistance proteinR1C-3 [Sesamum calycinum]|uniref:Late blight resistance proteinR1C-3 n=1 Tax=Sesamum calycinum TaxID=2727403 RepID=A0AAW2JE81_9LAMI
MAGIGKTTLAKEIYEHRDIVSRFECRVFVSVGPKYFKDQKTLQDIQAQMDHEINGRRCLIVLDDVWSDDIWFDLTSFSGNELHNGSRIIMTTRLEEVAESDKRKRMRLGRFVLKKRFLNQQESWLLFCNKMFGGDHSSCPPKLQESAREIVNKCEGLPLTIIAVANHLCQAERTPEYWEQVAKKVHTDIISADKATSQVFYRSYKHLQIYLKPCFLYMGVFPHDADITASKLIKLWCAEGLLEPGVGKSSLEEYKAMEYLQELVSANVVKVRQRSSSGGINTCNIYPVFWHICMREAAEHKFFHVIDSNGNHGIESQHRHCIHNNGLFGIKDVRKSMTSIPNTRSILCTGPHHQYPVPICLDFSLLRVLDALTIRFYCFPSEVVKLVQLKYLAFTYNGKLPASISKLWNLEYLIVRQYLNILSSGAHRPYLPKEIWDMRGLRHLQVMGSDLPDPSYDGALLPNLSTLLGISARSCTKEILGRIPRLKKLGIQIELALNVDEPLCCFDHLVSLHRLESLKCIIVNPNSKLQVVIPAPPASIFPLSLRKLTLSGLGFPWEYMSTIVELSYLEVLKLQCYAFRGAVWKADDEHCFRKLKFLLIEDTDMEVWDASDVDFPSLEHLIIRHCYKLKEIPEKFGDIGPLQTIELVDCSPSLMASANIIQDRLMYLKKGFQVCIESSVDDRKLKP